MLKTIRLATALLACLAWPALAQTASPSRSITPPRTMVATPATPAKVDINSATEQQLDTLPGIGPARAKAIIAGRPYDELQALVAKKVLTQGVFDGMKGLIAY